MRDYRVRVLVKSYREIFVLANDIVEARNTAESVLSKEKTLEFNIYWIEPIPEEEE